MEDWTKTHMLTKRYIGRLYLLINNYKKRLDRSLLYQ